MPGYDKEQIIGSGMFGQVWLVKSRLSRHTYVLKEINISATTESERKQASTEVAVLSKLKHKHIVRYKEAVLDRDQGTLSIIMEYAESGDLHSAIMKQKGICFSERRILTWFIQICLGLQYIHFRNILHRDLKTQNIFLTRSKVIKIGDFGIARICQKDKELAQTSIGTPYYLSPEICDRKPYNHKSDMWALGCVLFEMAALERAFKANDLTHLIELISNGKRRDLPRWCSDVVKQLVGDLLTVDAESRPSTEDILAKSSLQPYLSDYMANCHNLGSFVPLLTTRHRLDGMTHGVSEKCSLNPREGRLKRTTTVNPSDIPRMRKQRNKTDRKEFENSTEKVQSPHSSKGAYGETIPRVCTISKSTKRTEMLPKSKHEATNSPPWSPTNLSTNATNLPRSTRFDLLSPSTDRLIMSDDASLDIDCGYESGKYGNSHVCKDKGHFTDDSPDDLLRKPSFTHCDHSDCHQCLLSMLWKNRILPSVGTFVNTDEYSKLKDHLMAVYDPDLLNVVYESLIREWGKENLEESVLLCFSNSLNFQQVRSLPLVLQLVQLDRLMQAR